MAKYLVTGGAGFIGSHIANALLSRGDEVRILDNLSTGKPENLADSGDRFEFIEGDIRDRDQVAQAVEGVEVIFHQAALASVPVSVSYPDRSHEACATGTLNVLNAARQSNVRRVVYAGSSSAYGNQPFQANREQDVSMPLSPYAAAKLAGEAYCQAFNATYGLETVVLRYFNVFGPRQDPNSEYSAVIPIFVTKMLAGQQPTIFGDGKQSRDFVYIEDVVQGNLAAAESAAASGKVLNLACGRQYSLLELMDSINRVLGTQIEPLFAKTRVGDVRVSLADISMAQQFLDYEPKVSFEEGLKRSIEYYRTLM